MNDQHFKQLSIQLNVLRLDNIHPVISGNKWFKLKYYLQQAIENNCTTIATFGGAYSNHILATAFACNKQNMQCIGFIRGAQPERYSQTLQDAQSLNMRLEFVSRKDYSDKEHITQAYPRVFFIPEGGYGKTGAKGAAEMLQLVPDISVYSYIICAVGTGTMLAGITNAGLSHHQFIGISVMKNNHDLENEMLALLSNEKVARVNVIQDYHFGGYAKHTPQLIDFMNKIWIQYNLPLDFVYTAKALYAVYDLTEKRYLAPDSNILFIHSGGLQGNRSMPKGTLLYG